jgi:hypothetical protein
MIRLSMVAWVVVIALSAFGLYSVKFKVQTLRTQIAQVGQQLEVERESANVVAAEWTYLNRPDRLQKLAAVHLQTREVTVEQIAEIAAIPFPRVVEASAPSPVGGGSGWGHDGVVHANNAPLPASPLMGEEIE